MYSKTASIRIKFLYLTEMLAALRDYFGSKNHSSRVFQLRACRLDVESFRYMYNTDNLIQKARESQP